MILQPATQREILAFLWRSSRQRVVLLASVFILMMVSVLLGLVQPFFYKEAVDVIAEGTVGDIAALQQALLMVVIGVALGMAHLTLHEAAAFCLARTEVFVMRRSHEEVFAHVQHLSTHFHANTFAGSTARRIGRGTDAIENMQDRMWFDFFPLLVTVLGIIVVFFFIAPVLGIAVIVSTLIYAPISVYMSVHLAKMQARADRQDTRVTASMMDAIAGNTSVKAFGAEEREEQRHGKVVGEWEKRQWSTWRYANFISWIQFMLMMLVELVLLGFAIWLWFKGEFTAGSFVLIYFYMGRLWGHLQNIGRNVRQYLQASAHLQEMVGLFHLPYDIADQSDAPSLQVSDGSISFKDVDFKYEQGAKSIFENFSTEIASGEKIALVGHSGGGKSTFVKLLLRLYDLQEGSISIDGQDVSAVTQKSLRQSIGLMPQDPLLFHRSIAENIRYGKPDASDEEIERVAKLAHAHEFIQNLPEGYDTLVGERGVKLSGGERQRVAIARAILADTPILILDEATSSLDSLSEKYIQEALEYLMKGRTTIVIAHRLSTIKKADRILVIDGGKIIEEGSHSALVKKQDGVYKGFYELQAGGFIGE